VDLTSQAINIRRPCTAAALALLAAERRRSSIAQDSELLTGLGGMDALRGLAEKRERNKDSFSFDKQKEKSDGELRSRLRSICTMCDALRSRNLSGKRSSNRTSEVVKMMCEQLSLPQTELLARLQLLADVVPEFLTIIQPDNVVPYSVIRLNMQAPYSQVRKKLSQYAAAALAKMDVVTM
jgi:hypothetical protein